MRIRPQPRNWVSGELAPWLDGLPGELINSGAKTLENFVVKKQGAIQRRPGSFYVASVKNAASETILIQCEIDSSNIYVLEMGNAYVRFYKNHAQVSLAAAAYEITSPYSTADLTDLRWTYIPDDKALYFAHHNYALRKLAWTSDTSWTFSQLNVTAMNRVMTMHSKGTIAYTDDFVTWDTAPSPWGPSATVYSIDVGKSSIISAAQGISPNGRRSVDAQNWFPESLGVTSVSNLAGNTKGEFVTAGNPSSLCLYSNDDGITWNAPTTFSLYSTWKTIGYDDSVHGWRISATSKENAWTQDGVNWTAITTGTVVIAAIQSDGADHWVGVGEDLAASGTICYAGSLRAPWTIALALSGGDGFASPGSVTYGTPNSLPLWVAITGSAGTKVPQVYNSSNGLTWVNVASIAEITQGVVGSVKWVTNRFLMASPIIQSQSLNYIYQSTDGTTFSKISDAIYTTPGSFSKWVGFVTLPITNLEQFNTSSHYPKTLTYHEGRLIVGPTDTNPATIWGSQTNILKNFYIGQFSDQAFSYDLASDRNVAIQWMIGGPELAIGTRTAEGVLRGSPEEGITPQTARMVWQSTFGSDNIQPVRIHDTIIFTQRGGEIVRGYIPSAGTEAWKSPDLTAFADHIARGGITEIDHQDDPQTVAHFVRSDGYGLGLTFEGTTRAWWRTKMGATASGYGRIESQCVIPTSGAEDELWAIVKWTVNGSVKRYIVYFDAYYFATKQAYHGVDCGYYNSAPASATVYSAVVPQLAGEAVTAVINGSVVENNLTVAAGGTVTIAATNATSIHIGLPYTSYAQTMRINPNSAWGSGAGITKRNGNLNVWVYNTIGGTFGPTSSVTEPNSYVSTTDLTTDCLSIPFPGQWDRDGYIWCIQSDPLPMTIVAIAPDMELGDR